MKSIQTLIVGFCLLSFNIINPGLTDAERQHATDLMNRSKDHLFMAVKDLSVEQLNYKSSPDAWSIAECVEHIAKSENLIFGFAEISLKVEADPSKRNEIKMTDEQIEQMIVDRTNKVKTTEPFKPTNSFGSYDSSLKEFKDKREAHTVYIKSTKDDLRNHYCDFPFGKIDSYQVILFMAAHSERHIKQIEEVKANANFPRK
jgi:hypothetical protein